jgi:CDP-2,3-bis-(O-geranylgeranyl)-sn-glycerol synthase
MQYYLIPLIFFLPAGIANAFPPIANKIPILNKWSTPMDFGQKFRGKRVFGAHKSWRGLISGALIAGVFAYLLFGILSGGSNNFFVDSIENFILGCALGFGALFGDAIESFFKRQSGIKSGESWLFFDQIDYVVGAILFSLPFARFNLDQYAIVILAFFFMHFIVSFLGYKIGLKDKPI